MTATPFVAAVVVNYATPELTIECVRSLERSIGVAVRIIVIDNASPDDSVALLCAQCPETETVVSPVNGGYAGGSNLGIARALALGADYVFLLNSDAVIQPDTIARLTAALEREPRAAMANPLIVRGENPDHLWFGGSTFSPLTGRATMVGWRQPLHRALDAGPIPVATGCALLLRVRALPDIGMFDTSLFGYAEDLDLSLRAGEQGWTILFVPASRVSHQEGVTHKRVGGQALRQYLTARNVIRVLGRHLPRYAWPLAAAMFLVDHIGRFVAVGIRDRDARAIAATFKGTMHAFTGGHHAIEPGDAARRALESYISAVATGQPSPENVSA